MVLLTLTPAIVQAIEKASEIAGDGLSKLQLPSEPPLKDPKDGNPISHSQLIGLSRLLKNHTDQLTDTAQNEGNASYTLESLLKGSRIYVNPPLPKKEPTPEYRALMERLRKEEEARAYERMINPPSVPETFAQRFPVTPHAYLNPPVEDFVDKDDDVSYQDVHRQIVLIINVLISIIACSVFIWVAARHWSVPKRLGLSMSGSGLIAIAEVAIYSGYLRRVKEAKTIEKKKLEVKEVVESWVIDGSSKKDNTTVLSTPDGRTDDSVRRRKGKRI